MLYFILRYRCQADQHLPSLIYQLLEYERALKPGGTNSPTFSDRSSIVTAEEEEWGRRRSMLDNDASDADVEEERDVAEVAREARALDKAMEDRMLARKSSSSSVASSSGLGMGVAWKSRYGGRRRTGSIASNLTTGSILSEDLVEENEEEELLNVGGGFDNDSRESDATSPDSQFGEESTNKLPFTPQTARPPVQHTSSSGPTSTHKFPRIPASATRATFDVPPLPRARLSMKGRRRPPPLSILPTVPSSPINPGVMKSEPSQKAQTLTEPRISAPALLPSRQTPPKRPSRPLSTPSQTFFVFPPSPSPNALPSAAPSTMILTPSVNTLTFPSMKTPRLLSRGSRGRQNSFVAPATPTTAFSRVDVQGWVGMK
jgi:tyrosine-protein phosphatase